jgi:hypothetical protein
VKRVHLAAIVIPLALVIPSCGGDSKDSPRAQGTTTAPQSEQAQSDAQPGAQDRSGSRSSSSKQSRNGNGGSSAADAERAAKSETASGGTSGKKQHKKGAGTNASPAEQLEQLSAKERRALDLDLYKQGKDYCYASGPKQVAADNQITVTDPAEIAERYARLREQAVPALILPFQQGCLAGFRRFERNPPKN